MEPGIYMLLLQGEGGLIPIGARGPISFLPGYYGYVGSALGPGGLSRVVRHIRIASSGGRKPRWHIDHLLMHPGFRLIRVFCAHTTERLECPLARTLTLPVIPGFGSTDCNCSGHLFFSTENPDAAILAAFHAIELIPVIRDIKEP